MSEAKGTYEGYTVDVRHDADAENPRTGGGSLFTIYTTHRRYDSIGDRNFSVFDELVREMASEMLISVDYWVSDIDDETGKDCGYWEDKEQDTILIDCMATGRVFPVYMYEHGNIALSASSFPCKFDSGMLGFAFISKEDFKEHCNNDRENAVELLQSDLKEVQQYCNGDAYFVSVTDEDGNEFSCGGVYADTLDEVKVWLTENVTDWNGAFNGEELELDKEKLCKAIDALQYI